MGKINKKRIIIGCLAIVLIVLVYGIGQSLAKPNSTFKNQKVDGLFFENASVEYDKKLSVFTVDVYNENKEAIAMKSIDIILKKDKNDKVTLTYEIEKLESDEGRKIIIDKIDYNLKGYNQVKYRINK